MTSHAPAAPFASPGAPDRTISRPLIPRARGTHRAQWNIAATAVIWATSLFVAALWVAGGGVQSLLAGGGETLTTLGRITGLVSANLLLYQALLMARVPLFERGFGRDAITRMHRWVGFWSFWLLLAHIVLLVLGYAVTAGVNPLAQAWDFVWNYPGMLLATAGTALLVMIVATSIRRARRRLRYESWHLLHLYGYLGVGLAIAHMLWTGADFLTYPLATVYWWTLWALVAAEPAQPHPLLFSTRARRSSHYPPMCAPRRREEFTRAAHAAAARAAHSSARAGNADRSTPSSCCACAIRARTV